MSRTAQELADVLGLPVENFHPTEPGLHMEILDTQTMQVWQVMANVKQEEYDALVVEDRYRKVGVGSLSAYCSFFRRSPDAERDGPMNTLEQGGYRWSNCAQPKGAPAFPAGPDGPRLMKVSKYHSIVYAAGSELTYLESPEGETYVHVIGGDGTEELRIPEGWRFAKVPIEKETIVELPCPTSVFFFASPEGMKSYQGPVPRPS